MPPHLLRRMLFPVFPIRSAASTGPSFSAQASSWRSPDDILTILMLIGGDIVQRAVAQLAGSGPGPFCPVAFSFGWLTYSVSALTSAIGGGRLTPKPDVDILLVNAKTGYACSNASWVLGRLLRAQELRMPPERGLTIRFYQTSADPTRMTGFPRRDWLYWWSVAVILAQLAIAVIPGALHGDWIVLMITTGGTLLVLVGSGLGQWRAEKYAGRRVGNHQREAVVLTRGFRSTFAMVVISEGVGIRLEDLAAGLGKSKSGFITSVVVTAALFVLWLVLLLTVEGLEGDAWYLLVVGGLGMLQNVVAASVTRDADALGFHLEPQPGKAIVIRPKFMETLMEADSIEPGVGLCLLPIFFPWGVRPHEQAYWDARRAAQAQRP